MFYTFNILVDCPCWVSMRSTPVSCRWT